MKQAEFENRLGAKIPSDLRSFYEVYGGGTLCPELTFPTQQSHAFFESSHLWPVLPPGGDRPLVPNVDVEADVEGAVLVAIAGNANADAIYVTLEDGEIDESRLWVANQGDSFDPSDWVVVEGPLTKLLCSLIDGDQPDVVAQFGDLWRLNPVFVPFGSEMHSRATFVDLPSWGGAQIDLDVLCAWTPPPEPDLKVVGTRSWAEVAADEDVGLEFGPRVQALFDAYGSVLCSSLVWWDPRDERYVELVGRFDRGFPAGEADPPDALPRGSRLVPLALSGHQMTIERLEIVYARVESGFVDDADLWVCVGAQRVWQRVDGDLTSLIYRALTAPGRCTYRGSSPYWPWERDDDRP